MTDYQAFHMERRATKTCIVLLCLVVGAFCESPTVDVAIGTDYLVAVVSERYLSVALGSSLVRERWGNWDFSSPRLRTLAAALSPCYLRLGGTDADFLIFDPASTNQIRPPGSARTSHVQLDSCDGWRFCRPKYKTNFTMTAADWDDINQFSLRAGWRLLFDLNVFLSAGGRWSTDNARTLLNYSVNKGYTDNLDFELGNEPNAYYHNFNFTINGTQLGQDFIELHKMINSMKRRNSSPSKSVLVGPDITRPRGRHSKSVRYLEDFLPVAKDVIGAVTWHQYYVNGRTAVVDNFTDPNILNLFKPQLEYVKKAIKKSKAQDKKVWLGETSSAWGGGAKGLSDTYAAGFMWMDKLGLAALHGTDVVIRQTFYRGAYALIDSHWRPNPDYWLSLLYKRLVGTRVLGVQVSSEVDTLRTYAHCTNRQRSSYPPGSVTLYGMNLLDQDVTLNLKGDLGNKAIDQFLLTPHTNGKLTSKLVRLNGKTLKMLDDVTFPPLFPKKLKPGDKVVLPSKTLGFFVIPSAKANACVQ